MLDDVWRVGKGIGLDERMPLLQFLTLPVNTQGITTLISPGGGKIRNVQVVYMQRKTEDTVNEDQPNPNCGVGVDPGDLSTNYTLDTSQNWQSDGFKLTRQQLEDNCRDNGQTFSMLMQREMDVLRRKVATVTAEQTSVLTGTWSSDVTTGTAVGTVDAATEQLQIATLNSDGTINKRGWRLLQNALEDSGFPSNVFLAGGGTMRGYMQDSLAGCCANEGIDVGRMFQLYGYAYAYDKRLTVALDALGGGEGQDQWLNIAPGALQLIQYNAAPWKDGFNIPDAASNYHHQVLFDDMTGLTFDLTLQDNCGTVTANLTWTGKVIGLPGDMFATGDPYEGMTYVTRGVVENP